MSTNIVPAPLLLRNIFGADASVKGCCFYTNTQTVVYTTGRCIVMYNTEHQQQAIYKGSEHALGITAMCLSSDSRFLAVAEKGEERPHIFIMDLVTMKRKKTVTSDSIQGKEFKSICFSSDRKYLYALVGGPKFELVMWHWEKSKVVSIDSTVSGFPNVSVMYEVVANPRSPTSVSVCGKGLVKQYKLEENSLKGNSLVFGKKETPTVLSQLYLEDNLFVCGTLGGELYLFSGTEFRGHLIPPTEGMEPVHAMRSYGKGFICGGGNGFLALYEKQTDSGGRDSYKLLKALKIDSKVKEEPEVFDPSSLDKSTEGTEDSKPVTTSSSMVKSVPLYSEISVTIVGIALHPAEDSLLIATDNNQLLIPSFSSMETLQPGFEPLFYSHHSRAITGIDICIRKPLVATSSLDRSIRIWNYSEQSLELYKIFSDEVLSVAIHPSGLYILAGFADKLRLMNILMEDIREFKSWPIRNCTECAFSNGGHYFAAAFGNNIALFNTYTCENTNMIKHPNNRVTTLYWTHDDSKLVTCGMDGSVYEWNTIDWRREGEFTKKTSPFTSAVPLTDGKTIYASSTDSTIKEITDFEEKSELSTKPLVPLAIEIAHSHRILFAALSDGSIRCYASPYPMDVWSRFVAHIGNVTRLKLSFDESMLFTGGEDGTFCMFEILDKNGNQMRKEVPHAEEILVSRNDIEEKVTAIAELSNQLQQTRFELELKLKQNTMDYEQQLKEQKDKLTKEIENQKARYLELREEMQKLIADNEKEIEETRRKNRAEMEDMMADFQKKHLMEVEERHRLQEELAETNQKWARDLDSLKAEHEREANALKEEHEEQINDERTIAASLLKEKVDREKENDEVRTQMEEDIDREIESLKRQYEKMLSDEKEVVQQLKGKNGIYKQEFESQAQQIREKIDMLKSAKLREKDMKSLLLSKEKEISMMKNEIAELNSTMKDKEIRLHEMKKRNQELDKFKFVLDYKIQELKKKIEPKEQEIEEKKLQMGAMEEELEKYSSANKKLKDTISDMHDKVAALNKEIETLRTRLRETESLKGKIRFDMRELATNLHDHKSLKDLIKKLVYKYVGTLESAAETVDIAKLEVNQEKARQMDFLQRRVNALSSKTSRMGNESKASHARILQENVELLKVINEYRKEIRTLRNQTQHEPKSARHSKDEQYQREIDMQKLEIKKLRNRIEELETSYAQRPVSRERLPPMDGFKEEGQDEDQ